MLRDEKPGKVVRIEASGACAPGSSTHKEGKMARRFSITAKYSGKCASCGGGVSAGDEVHYYPDTKQVCHLDCAGQDPPKPKVTQERMYTGGPAPHRPPR